MMKNTRTLRVTSILACIVLAGWAGLFAGGAQIDENASPYSIGIFVPGVVEGSPTYEMMAAGVIRAVEDHNTSGGRATYQIFEAGFNQAEWPTSLASMAASATYDLIVTSNPSLPEIILGVLESFPDQRFLALDGFLEGVPQVKTVYFNHYEQAYLAGYLAGLATDPSSGLSGSNTDVRIGLLAGQEYPVMDRLIRPGFLEGAKAVNADIELDFRILGNWYDAGRAADLVRSMIASGADVVLTIAGGGNQGSVAAATEAGAYVVWFDSSGYEYGPGTVIGSTLVLQEEYTYRAVTDAIRGRLDFGTADVHGITDGAIGFDFDSPHYRTFLPETLRSDFERVFRELSEGIRTIESPEPF